MLLNFLAACRRWIAASGSAPSEPPSTGIPESTSLPPDDAVNLRGSGQSDGQSDLHPLVRIVTSIAGVRDRDALEGELLEAAFALVPAAEAAFIRVVPWSGARSVSRTLTRHGLVPLSASQAVVELAVSSREALCTGTPADAHMLGAGPGGPRRGVSSVLAVPLIYDDTVAGVLYLITSEPDTTFDRQHLELLAALAGIGSVALKNVSHLEELVAETHRLRDDLRVAHLLIGDSDAMRRVFQFIQKVSGTDAPVLITGERGTGKELAARALHEHSPRASKPIVAINCAAVPDTLLEVELFGYEPGAFTSGIGSGRGKLEVADGGSLFLDEVGELPPVLQSKLLRVVQAGEFEPVGATRTVKVDVRLIAATNRDLEREVAEGRFLEELWLRLKMATLRMPPLRDRRQDIPALAAYFAQRFGVRTGRRDTRLSPAAMSRLIASDWPGNVRELKNAVERAVILSDGSEVGLTILP